MRSVQWKAVFVVGAIGIAGLCSAIQTQTIGQLLTSHPEFSKFESLATQAGYGPLLDSTGPDAKGFTVFAPTNDAFGKLSPQLMTAISSDPQTLRKVIGYMILPGGSQLVDLNSFLSKATVQGEAVLFGTVGGSTQTLTIPLGQSVPPPPVTTATVVLADRPASNGFLNGVNNVLFPPTVYTVFQAQGLLPAPDSIGIPLPPAKTDVTKPPVTTGSAPQTIANPSNRKIFDMLADEHRFNTFASLLKQAGLDSMLEGSEVYTVFAPTDAAFDHLPQGAMQKLTKDPALLKQLLLYHITRGRLPNSDLQTGNLRTAEGDPLSVARSGNSVTLGGKASVRSEANEVSNGIVHEIDAVLMPAAVQRGLGTGS